MPRKAKTGFDKYLDRQLRDPEFRKIYREARKEIDAVDQIIRLLDMARVQSGLSKAELARRIGAKPEAVRRLLTSKGANPTLATVGKLAEALGLDLALVPRRTRKTSEERYAAGATDTLLQGA